MFADELNELDIASNLDGDVARVAIRGELDINSAPRLIAALHEVARPPVRRVDLDCEGVTFLDSTGLRALIVGRNEATRLGVDLELVDASPAVSRVVEMTGLAGLLTGARSS
ncbi:MAG: anti-sigma factor antagonist [Acidimicrobiaceae bacterium]